MVPGLPRDASGALPIPICVLPAGGQRCARRLCKIRFWHPLGFRGSPRTCDRVLLSPSVRCVLDRRIADGTGKGGVTYAGRYYGQAYEVDGEVLLCGEGLPVGGFVDARIVDSDPVDLTAEVIGSR